jgi:hypothetical protein
MNRSRRSLSAQPVNVVPHAPGRVAAERTAAILATRGLALSDVSRESQRRYRRNSRYHIPHNFYFQMYSAGLSPTLHQVFALSELSNYLLSDWLSVFGFRLDDISHLQATLPRRRTALLDFSVYNPEGRIPWFTERPGHPSPTDIVPLSQILEAVPPMRLSSLLPGTPSRFLYAKIGRQDCLAFPELLPGSIVRANPASIERLLAVSNGEITRHLFLVEHSHGFCCSRLHVAANNRVTLAANKLPFAQIELQLGVEARILGALDLELRPLTIPTEPEVPPALASLWKPVPLLPRFTLARAGTLLRNARLRAGLSFRQASEMSRQVAIALHDQRYFVSPASLSDYEVSDTPPRHIHKIFTICILYGLRFGDLAKAFGLDWSTTEREPIPEKWLDQRGAGDLREWQAGAGKPVALKRFPVPLDRFEEIPFFLRDSLPSLSGLVDVSLRDVFWVEGSRSLHTSLVRAILVVVNHRKKKPAIFRRKHPWEQPVYLILKRAGSYALSSCSLEKGMLVLRSYAKPFLRPEHLRNHVEAEIVGQVVTVLRSLTPSSPHETLCLM